MSTLSLRNRLLIAASLTLVAFLGLAGVALDRAYISSARLAQKNQMKTHIMALLAAVEVDERGLLIIPQQLPETRLSTPNSGLYALILDQQGDLVWRSRSAIGTDFSSIRMQRPGIEVFDQFGDALGSPFYHSFGVSWEYRPGRLARFTVIVVEESDFFLQFIGAHRQQLGFWLGTAGLLLLVVQVLILRWGLIPLDRVAAELEEIEQSRQESIEGDYPREIARFSQRINLFIENERRNLKRYRDTLGDLAHSLKTPLAVISGSMQDGRDIDRSTVGEQLHRMENIVDYQLKRAALSQYSTLHTAVDISPVVRKIDASLHKVYADKGISSHFELAPAACFYGDESDLYELLGNLMDNAFKWAQAAVRYRAEPVHAESGVRDGVVIQIDDDGPGVPLQQRTLVLERGVRTDQQVAGQGIGLSVVREIVERYQGELEIGDSDMGGACIRLTFGTTA